MYEKIVVVTRKTRLQELIERFNSRAQAKFWLEHAGAEFDDYQREDDTYQASLDRVRRQLDLGLKMQVMDRSFLPTYLFTEHDIVVTIGQDGLVANTAKYAGEQPIVGVNPDPERFDGVLLPVSPAGVKSAVEGVLGGRSRIRSVTMAEALLNDGQRMLAFNDLFIGPRSHISLRYRIGIDRAEESQSSSGIIVSTGAGSTGWLSSIFAMAARVSAFTGGKAGGPVKLTWEDARLIFVVREPFVSRHSTANLVAGLIEPGKELALESRMPSGGVIFSDGIESDTLEFNSGTTARIRASSRQAHLVME